MTTSPIKELQKLLAAPAPGFVCEVSPYGFEKTTVLVETAHRLNEPANTASLARMRKLGGGLDLFLEQFVSAHDGIRFVAGPGSPDGIFAEFETSAWLEEAEKQKHT